MTLDSLSYLATTCIAIGASYGALRAGQANLTRRVAAIERVVLEVRDKLTIIASQCPLGHTGCPLNQSFLPEPPEPTSDEKEARD